MFYMKYLYESTLEEAIVRGKDKSDDEEEKRTTVNLPQITRIAFAKLKSQYDLPFSYIIQRTVTHGLSALQHEHKDKLKFIREAREALLFPKMRKIRNFMYELTVSVDGMEQVKRQTINIRKGIFAAIQENSALLAIEQSSMIRLCIYFSFATSETLFDEIKDVSQFEVKKFNERLEENIVAYDGFRYMEQKWKERTEEKNFKYQQTNIKL